MFLVAGTSTSALLWLCALLQLGCGQDIVFRDVTTDADTSKPGSPVPSLSFLDLPNRYCLAPPQPDNGEWRLQEDFCEEGIADCKVPEGTKLGLGYELIYNCTDGYKTNGSNIVRCRPKGNWSHIPKCKEILCDALNTVSRTGLCRRGNENNTLCDAPVPPKSKAEVSCRSGYTTDLILSTPGAVRQILNCNSDGIWVPQPIRCVQVCGRVSTDGRPLSITGSNASVSEFPWHVSLYRQNWFPFTILQRREGKKKILFCTATIIRPNIVMTSAGCLIVYLPVNDNTFVETIFVMAGNTFHDYDHPMHNPNIVQKTVVKTVYTPSNTFSLVGGRPSDIALLELEEPFVFSKTLLPACLVGSGSDSLVLDPGDNKTIVGFGVTTRSDYSPIPKTTRSLYVAYSGCNVSELTHFPENNFCARPDICVEERGGGLVSQMNDQWHVIGIASQDLRIRNCDDEISIPYTRVSDHLDWILGIISDHEPQQLPPSSNSNSNSPETTTSTLISGCMTPPQPVNGELKYHPTQCPALNRSNSDCRVPEGIELVVGTRLVFSCHPGYARKYYSEHISCIGGSRNSKIFECEEIECHLLNSQSRIAKCIRNQRWVDCDHYVLPGTRAQLSCRPGYSSDRSSTSMQGKNTQCSMKGEWVPNPIECEPVLACGLTTNRWQSPWQASLYWLFPESDQKVFRCEATIVHEKLVLTAASCVFDEETNSTIDSKRLFVSSGYFPHLAYHEPADNHALFFESAVKAARINGDYNGKDLVGDIALIEMHDPFKFSSHRLPACLDDFSSGKELLDPDAKGRVAEFEIRGIRNSSGRTTAAVVKTVPYVPYVQCKLSNGIAVKESLTSDKFCAGYKNESRVCIFTRGAGLIFEKHNIWYVMGIATQVPAINTDGVCNDYAICTNVSTYIPWIEDEIFNLKRRESQASSNDEELPSRLGVSIERPDNDETPSKKKNLLCLAPPQPENGDWMFHPSHCSNDAECKNLQGLRLAPGTQLVYRCSPGYRATGNTRVYCASDGNWSTIPSCNEIKCDSLNSESTAASCYDRYGKWVICDPAVPPGTRAEVSCRPGYKEETSVTTFRRETVICGENGKWTPDPIRCEAICGVATTHQTPLIINGTAARLGDFPWHATLYQQNNSPTGIRKDFICGGTIIHTNFVLTAAHCVYSEQTETTTDPKKLFVMTGNVFREYDFPYHNPSVVKTSAVAYVHRPCKYYGLRGNYVSDVALLELKTPFIFSNILSPACLDVEGHSQQVLEPGALGKVAGFGRTEKGESSGVLQTLTLPYVSYDQCKTSKHPEKNHVLITPDKFCAGYTDGSAVCEGDSGGGLVFRRSELYYVLGIVSLSLSVDLENGERKCDRYSYSLYTKVSDHMSWIQDVMSQRAQHNIHPPCR